MIARVGRWLRLKRAERVLQKAGIRRIAPEGVRGRVYVRDEQPKPPTAKVQPKMVMRARVQRAGVDGWEDFGVIARSE